MDKGLDLLIDSLKNLKKFASYGAKGKDFEDKVKSELEKMHFKQTSLKITDPLNLFQEFLEEHKKSVFEEVVKKLKDQVLDKKNFESISNLFRKFLGESNKYLYVYQPFGSQDFPDFLVFTENWIIPLEVKYSEKTNGQPKWNSNIPKSNSIYLQILKILLIF
ncbi:hypothetical protein [[Mycoplasma] mobile]|uniref:Uncharacterized protein n=1 Tax=Mycoplasma mobile (strain ATCC 43663 / 163K / NCTC 11711) TaxID=267748 RepID=Q6KIJ6_MYCM1|nr:hypothetical protein [[Mycoplasma] mobile]AAT27580.1 conserved hypothetical protein [Mycoplasma mobile 163K]